jgi:hypothetical protein
MKKGKIQFIALLPLFIGVMFGFTITEDNYNLNSTLMYVFGFAGIFLMIFSVLKEDKIEVRNPSKSNDITYITESFFGYLRECEENSIPWTIGIFGYMATGKSFFAAKMISEIRKISPEKMIYVLGEKEYVHLNMSLFQKVCSVGTLSTIKPNSILLIDAEHIHKIIYNDNLDVLLGKNISVLIITQGSLPEEIIEKIDIFVFKGEISASSGLENLMKRNLLECPSKIISKEFMPYIKNSKKLRMCEAFAVGINTSHCGIVKIDTTLPEWDKSSYVELKGVKD